MIIRSDWEGGKQRTMKDYNRILKENSTMESTRLILRPFSMEDVQDVFLYASDDAVTKYLTWPTHVDISQTEKVVKEIFMGTPGIFAIELKSEGKCIGCIDLRICAEHDKGSFGYTLNREYWNKGYVTEALGLLIDFAFSNVTAGI